MKGLDAGKLDLGTKSTGKGEVIPLEFLELAQAANDSYRRDEFYEGKKGRLTGQFAPSGDDKKFTLVRLKRTCCAADAVPLNVIIVSEKPVRVKRGQWVEVFGQIHFAKRTDREEYVPVLLGAEVKEIAPDPNPFIQ